jgi:hypothetical protein
MNDLKSQHAVEPNGTRHIVGRQCDSADALDHRDTLAPTPCAVIFQNSALLPQAELPRC